MANQAKGGVCVGCEVARETDGTEEVSFFLVDMTAKNEQKNFFLQTPSYIIRRDKVDFKDRIGESFANGLKVGFRAH